LPAQLQAPFLLGLSALVVFLCLAALYESWTIPLAVLLTVPLGICGAVLAATLRGLQEAAAGEMYGPPASLSS
jgi:multidrug efflux pump subunit AcrB